jgi:putative ATP-binding cassette transporter
MKLIFLLLRSSWVIVVLAVLMGLLSGASSTGLIALINTILGSPEAQTAKLTWSFVGLCFLLLLSNTASQALLAHLSEGVIFDLRMILSRRILASGLSQFEAVGAPRLLATLTDDIQSVSAAFLGFPFVCTNIAIVVSCLVYLSWLSPLAFILMLSMMALGVASVQFLSTKGEHSLKLAREEQDRLFRHFRAITEGFKELKLHEERQKTFLEQDLQATAAASRHYNVVGRLIFAFALSWGLLAIFITIGLLLFGLPRLVVIEPIVLSGYALVTIYLIQPLGTVLGALPLFSKANIALAKIESLGLSLATLSRESIESPQPKFTADWQLLELVDVTHTYYRELEESSFTLGPINLIFHPGELVFILGGNGSGKSTLAKLITGLYSPETGEIRLDGKSITNSNQVWYHQHFSAVFSDFYLFEQLTGVISSTDLDSLAHHYLVQLQLDRKVQAKEGMLSTTALSQGQRKRLALLAAYLEDRPIYLFDEWASDQDPVFKEIFYTQLLPELKSRGKTVLVISHDDRYFHLAERIVKLDYGQVEYDKSLID